MDLLNLKVGVRIPPEVPIAKQMQLYELKPLDEASYPGNLGMMEMFKFYQVATEDQKKKMKSLITQKKMNDAWELLQVVTGVKLRKL